MTLLWATACTASMSTGTPRRRTPAPGGGVRATRHQHPVARRRGRRQPHETSAVRDLWQGIELVFKERLHHEHWSLVFESVNKADKATYDSGDFTSVGFDACVERLRGICGVDIAPRDFAALKSLQKKRGRLE